MLLFHILLPDNAPYVVLPLGACVILRIHDVSRVQRTAFQAYESTLTCCLGAALIPNKAMAASCAFGPLRPFSTYCSSHGSSVCCVFPSVLSANPTSLCPGRSSALQPLLPNSACTLVLWTICPQLNSHGMTHVSHCLSVLFMRQSMKCGRTGLPGPAPERQSTDKLLSAPAIPVDFFCCSSNTRRCQT